MIQGDDTLKAGPDPLALCPAGGILVGADYTIPEDPSEFYCDDRLPQTLGCNRLVCRSCGADVRNAPHFGARPGFGAREREVYETEDWRTVASDILLETPGYLGRFYLCRCTRHLECRVRLVEDPDPDPFDAPLPWRCAGHPRVTLPGLVDGVRIDAGTDFRGLVERSFRGEDPKAARPSERALPAGWVTKLYFRLLATPARNGLVAAIAGALQNEDAVVRSRALIFFARFPELEEAEAVARTARRHPELFHGVRDATRIDEPLETRLRSFLGKRLGMRGARGRALDEAALDLARSEVLMPGDVAGLLLALGSVDDRWLGDHAVDVARVDPERWADIVGSLARLRSKRTGAVVRDLLAADLAEAGALRAFARKRLDADGRRVVLEAVRAASK